MATTFYADNYTHPMPSVPAAGVTVCREFSYLSLAAFVINDIVKLCKIPGLGQPLVLTDFFLDIPDYDTNTVIALSIGDNDTPGKFVAIQTVVGQSAGKFTLANAVAASMPAVYTANNDFIMKITTAPTGGQVGTVKGWIKYHLQGLPTTVS